MGPGFVAKGFVARIPSILGGRLGFCKGLGLTVLKGLGLQGSFNI